MAGTLRFPLEPVICLMEHAMAATQQQRMFEEPDPVKPGLLWFKDVGTGLLSSGLPRPDGSAVWARTEDDVELRDIVYNDDPATFDTVWETTRTICGGDDFIEKIDLDKHMVSAMRLARSQGFVWFTVTVDGDSFELGFTK